MTKYDKNKLIKAGFTILRTYEAPVICIKEMDGENTWRIAERFETKAALNRRIEYINNNYQKMIFE